MGEDGACLFRAVGKMRQTNHFNILWIEICILYCRYKKNCKLKLSSEVRTKFK